MPTKFVLKQNLPKTLAKNNPTLAEYVFDDGIFTFGSEATNNLVLAEAAPEQAVIIREDDHIKLINSAEGTQLNGRMLSREAIHPLADGDEINLGNHIIFVVEEETNILSEKAALEISRNLERPTDDFDYDDKRGEKPADIGGAAKTSRNFAAVLDTLRTEEDSFYFTVKNGEKETGRVPLEQAEMPIGINSRGELSFVIEEISNLFAVVRKDWSGILLESQQRNSVFVNGETVETPRRLRNDDCVNFSTPNGGFFLVLHEPSLLVALEPMLSVRDSQSRARSTDAAPLLPPESKRIASTSERLYFKYFNLVEMGAMFIGTLIGSVLFFLFFEFIFS